MFHWNNTRYKGQTEGHYESFFQRANHPTRPLAFWIRYTLFSPKSHPEEAKGELWAIFFNGQTQRHVAVKSEVPFQECLFHPSQFKVQVSDAHLDEKKMAGKIFSSHSIEWDLNLQCQSPTLLLLPEKYYFTKFPAAKSLVGMPLTHYTGELKVDGEPIEISDWVGSQNHNWGRKHTDRYAWGQVCGFENAPESFLEVATAQLKFGPVWTPPFTPIVLRHQGKEIALNNCLWKTLQNKGSFRFFDWNFSGENSQYQVKGRIWAPRESFVGLCYHNPPGGDKTCLNTKIASCEIQLIDKNSKVSETLFTSHRAAFEILTDSADHGVVVSA